MHEAETVILNLDQQPFESFDMAAKMRDLLINESVHQYRVDLFEIDNESAGFVIIRTQKEQRLSNNDKDQVSDSCLEKKTVQQSPFSSSKRVDNKTYHPALRTYLLYFPLAVGALFLVLFAVELWGMVLSILDIKGLPVWIDGGVLVNLTKMAGSMLIIWISSTVLINYYGTALVIDSHGLTFKKGILTRDVTHIRFSEIRTIGLRQGLLDRLLNIGILEFASSGTDDVDIRFINIANPIGVKAELEAIIEKQIQAQ